MGSEPKKYRNSSVICLSKLIFITYWSFKFSFRVSNILNIVTLNPEKNNEISIYDVQGKKVKVIDLDNITHHRIDISELVKGIYIVKIKGEDNFAYKLIKE